MKNFLTLLILVISSIFAVSCGARSDYTTPEMAQNMLKLRGYHFTEAEFFRAIQANDGVSVKGFLQGGINPNAKNLNGETALTYSIQKAETPLIKLLVESADFNLRDDLGNSPIHLALKKNKDIFDLLLEKNADVNIPGRMDSKMTDQTVLYLAIARSDEAIVKRLIDRGANPNIADGAGSLPLVEAVVDSDANANIVKMLLENGAEVNKTETENGAPALIFAAQNKEISSNLRKTIVEMLIEKGADKKIKEKGGKTALDWAKEKNNSEIIDLLK
jgi:ankyrin repeat protein